MLLLLLVLLVLPQVLLMLLLLPQLGVSATVAGQAGQRTKRDFTCRHSNRCAALLPLLYLAPLGAGWLACLKQQGAPWGVLCTLQALLSVCGGL